VELCRGTRGNNSVETRKVVQVGQKKRGHMPTRGARLGLLLGAMHGRWDYGSIKHVDGPLRRNARPLIVHGGLDLPVVNLYYLLKL
jgi:hypothetical protein